MTPDDVGNSPGWFPDPLGRYDHRYFNGSAWTADVADDGARHVDPLGTVPSVGASSPAVSPSSSRGGTTALIAGIIAVATTWMPLFVIGGLLAAAVALIAGRNARRAHNDPRARTGMILGISALVVSVIGIWLTVILFQAADGFLEPGRVIADDATCEIDDGTAIASGAITNRSSDITSYTVFVDIVASTDGDTVTKIDVVELTDVAPDQPTRWQASAFVGGTATECEATPDVFGPYPFGVPVDRP